jgi:hypothetical protein
MPVFKDHKIPVNHYFSQIYQQFNNTYPNKGNET